MPLPGLVDYDTLLIAPALVVRGGAVRPVADELLAAANDPDQLVDIDPTVVPVRAADPLSLDDDPASLGAAVAILRDAVAQALPAEFGLARPDGFEGRLVWWPEPEYVRLKRQLPELAALLGDPWRGHTALCKRP